MNDRFGVYKCEICGERFYFAHARQGHKNKVHS